MLPVALYAVTAYDQHARVCAVESSRQRRESLLQKRLYVTLALRTFEKKNLAHSAASLANACRGHRHWAFWNRFARHAAGKLPTQRVQYVADIARLQGKTFRENISVLIVHKTVLRNMRVRFVAIRSQEQGLRAAAPAVIVY